jgi:hypothetical protein
VNGGCTAEAAGLKASGPVIAAPQAIVVAKPKPKKPKGQQPYMTIQMQDAMITSW